MVLQVYPQRRQARLAIVTTKKSGMAVANCRLLKWKGCKLKGFTSFVSAHPVPTIAIAFGLALVLLALLPCATHALNKLREKGEATKALRHETGAQRLVVSAEAFFGKVDHGGPDASVVARDAKAAKAQGLDPELAEPTRLKLVTSGRPA